MEIITKLKDSEWWKHNILTDLYFLCRNVLMTLEDPTPGFKDLYRPTHKRICNFVSEYAKPGHEILVLCPRLWLKSYIITCGWLIQQVLRNLISGSRKIWLIAHAVEDNAQELLWRVKYNIQFNEELRFHFKDYLPRNPETEADRWTKSNIELSGNRIEIGAVEKALESRHYGGGVINDDLVGWINSRTRDQLLKTIEWWKVERPLLLPWSTKINLGTRWDEDDLYGWWLSKFLRFSRKEFEELRKRPIFEVHRGRYHFLYVCCYEDPVNEKGSTFPNLYPEEELKRIIAEMGDLAGGQLLNDPLSMLKGRINKSWFVNWKEGQVPSIRTTLLLVDPCGSDTKNSDYSGMCVVDAAVDKRLYVRLAERHLITDKALAEKIITIALQFYPSLIGIEEGKFRTIRELLELMIPGLIRRGQVPKEHKEYVLRLPYILVELKHHGRPKELRIDNLSGWIESARMLFAPYGMDDVIDELLRFRKTSKDDIADALAYVLDLLARVGFPKPTDPVKFLVVPEELKMSPREREERDWEQYMEDCGLGEPIAKDEFGDF